MQGRQFVADAALVVVVTIWGSTFVMVQDAVRAWPVFSFLTLRFTIAGLAFLPFLLWPGRRGAPQTSRPKSGDAKLRGIVLPAVLAGLALGGSYAFQTLGLLYTTPARAGFITGLNVVMVPVGAALLLRQRVDLPTSAGVVLATAGLGVLSLTRDLSVGLGDLLVTLCAVCIAAQILLVAHYASRISPLHLAAVQIATMAVGCAAIALLVDLPAGLPPLGGDVLFAAVFTGLLATTVAFTVQAWAQRFTSATHIALIFSLEPVTAAVASYLLVGEVLTSRALLGCALILGGMLAAEFGRAVGRGR